MSEYYMESILLKVYLKGQISGFVKHVDNQIVTVDVTPIGSKHPETMSKKILHTNRVATECSRNTRISEEAVKNWASAECPFWEKPHVWKTFSRTKKIESFLKRFDEGHGISYEFIN